MATFQKDPETDNYVSCPRCSCEIPLAGTIRLPREFSVLCPNCGRRDVYQPAEAHDPKQGAAATRTAGSIQFSTGKKEPIRPKSWLNEWACSVLQ